MIYKSNTGVEITNNLGFGFIKFGFESIKSDFEADLRRCGLEVMRAASIVMDPAVVIFIYRDSRESFFTHECIGILQQLPLWQWLSREKTTTLRIF